MRFRPRLGFASALVLFAVPSALPQTGEINRQNRTVEVMVTETARIEPDIANISVGCITYGPTHDQAYQANLATADKVIKALLSTGLPTEQIESGALELSEDLGDTAGQPATTRKPRQFKVHQTWRIRVAAAGAQKLIDVAVQAGANGVENVGWDVADEESLEGQAREAAMQKARKIAGALAKSAGSKLGDLLYASNVTEGMMVDLNGRTVASQMVGSSAGGGFSAPAFSLRLFPEKVSKQATVRAVFAME
jgi:uncharacterized protein YggE